MPPPVSSADPGALNDPIRVAVELELGVMTAAGGVLDAQGPAATSSLFYIGPGAPSARRIAVQDGIIDAYMDLQPHVLRGGRCAIMTAGVPGAGKSTAVKHSGLAGADWRVLDADKVKDLLLAHEVSDGTYQALLSELLADGHPLMPRELASLVHLESTQIIDAIRERCILGGENIVIEGTLAWAPGGPRLLRQLAAADYQEVTIFDVETEMAVAAQRASDRWWQGRTAAIAGGDAMGGRFTPAAAIVEKYLTSTGVSVCAANARDAFNSPQADEFAQMQLIVSGNAGGVPTRAVRIKRNGVLVPE